MRWFSRNGWKEVGKGMQRRLRKEEKNENGFPVQSLQKGKVRRCRKGGS